MRMSHMSDSALRRAMLPALAVTGVLLIAGCGTPSAVPRGPGIDGSDAVAVTRLVPLSPADKAGALVEISGLQTKGRGPKTGYSRDQFGEAWTDDSEGVLWAGNGCSTRDDILNRDLDHVEKRDKCVVVGGQFTDPYTDQAETFSKSQASDYPIDHIVPLSYSWQMGAAQWPADKRVQLANDPLNLTVTTVSVNSAKGGSGPASYLPPNKAIRCAYALRFAQVATKYALAVTSADKDMLAQQCVT